MNPKEIVLANLNHSGAPRPGLTFDNGRVNDFCGCGIGNPRGYTPRRWVEGKVEYYDDVWGNIWVRMVGGSIKGEIHKAVLNDWSDLREYQPPVYDETAITDRLKACFAEEPEKFHAAYIGGWIFDNARYLRKLEIYLMDMALYPEELKTVHAMVGEVYAAKIRAAGEAGADAVAIGEDMGTQQGLLFSPEMWREYFAELYKELFALAHEYGMKVLMHSCGQNREILPDLLEAGVDCFQFDQPMVYDAEDLSALLREHKAALWSPVDIQKVLPTGDRALIEEQTRCMLRSYEGGLLCKNYPDLPGIGVKPEWDDWAYREILKFSGLDR